MPVEFPNIRHLRAFREVAEQKSISAGAERVHLSQPAVTHAIAGLERSLDCVLFDRRPTGMFVNEAGTRFLVRVQRSLALLEEGAEKAHRLAARRDAAPIAHFHTHVSASQLRALVAIWEGGSFSLAARDIGVSQPSIHRAGRDLERLAGMTLFAVTRNGVELTPPAEAFAHAVKLAAAELRQGYYEVASILGRDSTKIAIGSMPLSRTSILPQAIHGLLSKGSGVQIQTVDGPYPELLRALRHGDLDILIGALRDPVPADDVVQEVILDDRLAVVASPRHPLAGRRKLSLQDTLDYPWIAPPKATPTGSYLFKALRIGELERTPVRIVSSSLVLVRGLLALGDYVTILSPHQAAVERATGYITLLDIDLPDSTRPIALTVRKGWSPTPTQGRFLDLLREAAKVAA